MNNDIKLTFTVSNFMPLSEDFGNRLVGGFSQSQSLSTSFDLLAANNCNGGNCTAGCGQAGNVNCNAARGCCAFQEPDQ